MTRHHPGTKACILQRTRHAVLAVVLALIAAPAAAQPALRVERVLRLGGDFGGRDAAFVEVADIATAPSGELYVLDSGDRAVKVYTPAGRFLRRFGRQGGGPGEFLAPTSLRVDSLVRVSDLAQHRMSHFRLDGRHVETVRTPEIGELPLLGLVPLRNGRVVGSTPVRLHVTSAGERTGSQWAAVLLVGPGGRADTLLRLHGGGSAFHADGGRAAYGSIDSHVGRGGAHAVLGDSIVATADGYSGEVRWYRADRTGLTLVRARQLQSRSRPVTREDVRRIERLLAADPELPRRLTIEPPPRVSIATQALFAPDGSLWIRNTAGRGQAHVWTVFDAAGEIAMRLSLPAGFELRHVRGDHLYGIARTENDAPVVQVYRLLRG